MGPGTLNIAGPVGTNVTATLGADSAGIAYTEFGFASPFINVGASITLPETSGGWVLGATGTQAGPDYDLIVQRNTNGFGPTGPVFSLIRPDLSGVAITPASVFTSTLTASTITSYNEVYINSMPIYSTISSYVNPNISTLNGNLYNSTVRIGYNAGTSTLGGNSIAIGTNAWMNATSAFVSTTVINATGNVLNPLTSSALYIAPIRNAAASNTLYYNSTTAEITYAPRQLTTSIPQFGNVLLVDAQNGNDTTASRNGLPYSTINAAASNLTTGDTMWVMPGTYQVVQTIELPTLTSIRGVSMATTQLEMLNTNSTTMFVMGNSTRIEDVTVRMTPISGDSNVTAVSFPGSTAQSARISGCSLTLDTTGVTAGTGNVYGVYADGSNASSPGNFAFNAIVACSLNVYSQNTGRVNGMLLVNSTIMSTRDVNIYVSSSTTGCGIETVSSAAVILRTTAVSGGVNDIKQTSGTIQLGSGSDLINRTTGGLPFTSFLYPTSVFYGVQGNIFSNSQSLGGYLWPGTEAAVKNAGKNLQYPDTKPVYYKPMQSTIVYGFTANLILPPETGSTILQLYKNDIPTAFTVGYGSNQSSILTYYASTFTVGATDRLSWSVSSVGAASHDDNRSHDLTIQMQLY